jgi:putative DNA primase/helicase
MISFVRRCYETETRTITLEEVFDAIKTGSHGLKERITQIQNRYEAELAITGDPEKARKAVADLKMELPGFLPSGLFSERANDKLVEYSALLCADVDAIGEEKVNQLKEILKLLPFIRAVAKSPTGCGCKILFNVINDPSRHGDSFRSIRDNMLESFGIEIDEKCKDLARISFFPYDPDLWVRLEGNEPIPPADPLPSPSRCPTPGLIPSDLTAREQIAFRFLGELRYSSEKGGYFVDCPGVNHHTNKTADKHTILYLESVPTLVCQHESCSLVVEAFNKLLRSEIGKAEFKPERTPVSGKNGEEPAETKEDWFTKIQSSIVLATKEDIGSLILKPRVPLLGDWLCEGDYGIIFGPRGVAKTWFSLMIANAIATAGTIGEWEADTIKKVLFIDGEMPADMIRDRLLGFGGSKNITLLNHEILFERTQSVINVTDIHQQNALLQLCILEQFKLLILDNLSVCAFGIKENDSFEWEQLHRWLLQFRRHGIAVILLHHAGKTGQIRGTTKREDAAAWVISLTDAKERSEDKRGSRFISYFAKQSRNCMNTPAYEWHVVLEDGRVDINWKLAQGADILLQCIKEGVSECAMIAGEMGVSPATVCRLAKKLQNEGKIEIRGRKYVLSLSEACE